MFSSCFVFFLLAHLIFIFEPALALLENVTKKMHFLGYIWSTKLHCLEKSLWKRLYLVARQTIQWMHMCYFFLRIVRRIWALCSPRHIVSEMTPFLFVAHIWFCSMNFEWLLKGMLHLELYEAGNAPAESRIEGCLSPSVIHLLKPYL